MNYCLSGMGKGKVEIPYTAANLLNAVKAVTSKMKTYREAERAYNVPIYIHKVSITSKRLVLPIEFILISVSLMS